MIRKYIFLLLFCLVFAGCNNITQFLPACDGISYNFYSLYHLPYNDINDNFDSFVQNQTMILNGCNTTNYLDISNEDKLYKKFNKYDIKTYNVSFSCDLIEFDTLLFVKDKSVYLMEIGMGPCGGFNIRFIDNVNESSHLSNFLSFERFVIINNPHKFCKNYILKNPDYSEDECNNVVEIPSYIPVKNFYEFFS